MKNVYVICAKCGSENVKMKVDLEYDDELEEDEPTIPAAYFYCNNCSTLTSIHEHNDWLKNKQ